MMRSFLAHLVFAEEGKMEKDLDGVSVGGHDDELCDSSVERLGSFVCALFELLVVGRLLHEVEDLCVCVPANQNNAFTQRSA
jgi:hypothetical protein